MGHWDDHAAEWGASSTAILLRHASGEHRAAPSRSCTACVRHLPGLHNQLSHGKHGTHLVGGGKDHGGPSSSPPPMTDAEYGEHTRLVEAKVAEALRGGKSTDAQHAIDVDRGIWSPERAKIHGAIVEQLYEKAREVPSEGKAVIAGGLGGAGKSTVLGKHAHIDSSKYLTLNPDDMKEEIVNRGLAPTVEGLSPMESAALIHEESSHITNLLAKRAYADKKNVIWDITMASKKSTQRRVEEMRAAGYDDLTAVFVDIPVETSVTRALGRHRRGMEKYRNGIGFGGRYVPPALIRKNAVAGRSSANRVTFDGLHAEFDHWSLYDNSGSSPKLISLSGGDTNGQAASRDQHGGGWGRPRSAVRGGPVASSATAGWSSEPARGRRPGSDPGGVVRRRDGGLDSGATGRRGVREGDRGGESLAAVLLGHASGEHAIDPSRSCLACQRKFNPNQARDPHSGKWTDMPGVGGTSGAVSHDAAESLITSIHDTGGFTFDPRKGGLVEVGKVKGVAVAIPHTETIVGHGENVDRDEFIKGVTNVIMQYGEAFANGAMLGGWYSEDRSVYMVEVTDLVPDREEAIKLGKQRNQEGVFDLGTGEYIDTGGTGG